MAVADNVGAKGLGMGIGMGINVGIGLGRTLTISRDYPLPAIDTPEEETFDGSCLKEQQELPARDQEDIQRQTQQQHQQRTSDVPQQGLQSKPSRSASAASKQHPLHFTQHLQLPSVNDVTGRDITASEGICSADACGDVGKDSMQDLEDLLTKLNPLAKEFVPPSRADSSSSVLSAATAKGGPRKKNGYNHSGKRRVSNRSSRAHREDSIRRTVYVSDIDQQVTEEQLAALFITCGQVVDCRVCGDPNSVLRFAFVEFTDEVGARAALSLAGTMLGYYPVRVLPSKTAIVPVNPTFLPRVSQADVKLFFESLCGEVARLRLLGDYHHSTRIAFVEFVLAESAMAALNCSGAILGSLPIRVSPSKTPVRPRSPRSTTH